MKSKHSLLSFSFLFICLLHPLSIAAKTEAIALVPNEDIQLNLSREKLEQAVHLLCIKDEEALIAIRGKSSTKILSLKYGQKLFLDKSFKNSARKSKHMLLSLIATKEAEAGIALSIDFAKDLPINPKRCDLKLKVNEELVKELRDKWSIGGFQVSHNLLWKQHFLWKGQDLLFKEHGGNKHKTLSEKFQYGQEKAATYLYLKPHSSLYWIKDKWSLEKPSKKTETLFFEGISDKTAFFILTDSYGLFTKRLSLDLQHSDWYPFQETEQIKFLQQKDLERFKISLANKVFIIRKKDWFIWDTDGNILEINSKEELEKLLTHRVHGNLIIVNGAINNMLELEVYNPSRTKAFKIKIPSESSAHKQRSSYPSLEEIR